jgi:hypothetical protein
VVKKQLAILAKQRATDVEPRPNVSLKFSSMKIGSKKILGLLTSGGDAPGMNAAIRAVTRAALGSGFRVLGFQHGYEGILHEQFQELDSRSVSNIIQRAPPIF